MRALSVFGIALLAYLTCACESDRVQQAATEHESAAVGSTVRRGPVTMTVTIDRGEITIADILQLTVEVHAELGVDVDMPSFGDQLNEFTIRDFRQWPAVPVESKRIWKQEYDLDMYLSGAYQIPALTATFRDQRASQLSTERSFASARKPAISS